MSEMLHVSKRTVERRMSAYNLTGVTGNLPPPRKFGPPGAIFPRKFGPHFGNLAPFTNMHAWFLNLGHYAT